MVSREAFRGSRSVLEYLKDFFMEIELAEKKSPKEVMALLDRELEQWKSDPVHLADMCFALEEKEYMSCNIDDQDHFEMSALYSALKDMLEFRTDDSSDHEADCIFWAEYESVESVDLCRFRASTWRSSRRAEAK